jgi:hypothetical protein
MLQLVMRRRPINNRHPLETLLDLLMPTRQYQIGFGLSIHSLRRSGSVDSAQDEMLKT